MSPASPEFQRRIRYNVTMSELSSERQREHQVLPSQTRDAFAQYADQVFLVLEEESDPDVIDVEINELLSVVLRHSEFSPGERLRELASVSHQTMILLRHQMESAELDGVRQRAGCIHNAYAQILAESLVELAKIGWPTR